MKKIRRKVMGEDLLKEFFVHLKRLAIAGATAGYLIGGWWLVWFFITR